MEEYKTRKPRGRRTNREPFDSEAREGIANILSEIVKSTGLTQKDFCTKYGIAATTVTNIYNPNFGKLPTASTLRKIASASDNPQVYYESLMELAGLSTETFPLNIEEGITQTRQNEESLKLALIPKITALPIKGAISFNDYASGHIIDMIVSYEEESVISKWFFEFKSNLPNEEFARSFIWKILENKVEPDYKYSIVTSSTNLLPILRKLDLKSLNTNISVIEVINDQITETYLQKVISDNDISSVTI